MNSEIFFAMCIYYQSQNVKSWLLEYYCAQPGRTSRVKKKKNRMHFPLEHANQKKKKINLNSEY